MRMRIGQVGRPNREWEVWNNQYRNSLVYGGGDWRIWHPAFVGRGVLQVQGYASLQEALDEIAYVEASYTKRLRHYRTFGHCSGRE